MKSTRSHLRKPLSLTELIPILKNSSYDIIILRIVLIKMRLMVSSLNNFVMKKEIREQLEPKKGIASVIDLRRELISRFKE